MNVTVTLDATPALLAAVNNLASALAGSKKTVSEPAVVADEPKQKSAKPKAEAQPAAAEPIKPVSPAEDFDTADAEPISIEYVRAIANTNREKAKKVLIQLGYENLSSIPAAERSIFVAKLKVA